MTTMAKVDETLARFNRKSPRDAYKQVCEELGVHCQRQVYNKLPDVASAWHRVQSLELDNILLGPKGCMALLPCIMVSTTLRKITLRACGVSDDFVHDLCEILQNHPTVRAVDISDNDLVTVYSASSIISLMKNNSNMVGFDVDGTHVGDNVGGIIAGLGEYNRIRVASYYVDNYFKLRDLFGYLDETGEGWVLLKALVMNCPYPVLQEQFVERISKMKPQKRSNSTISINTFLSLVYINYKTEEDIKEHTKKPFDEPYIFMIANWKQIIAAVTRRNEAGEGQKVGLPEDLSHFRIQHYLLTNEEADSLVKAALCLHNDEREAAGETEVEAEVTLTAAELIRGKRMGFSTSAQPRPYYQFFVERDAAYIPDIMRNGSRLMSMGGMSEMMQSRKSVASGSEPEATDYPARSWSTPSSLVKQMVEFFGVEFKKVPVKRESVVADSPRTAKDKAMIRPAIQIETLLKATFETEYERLKPELLRDYYKRAGLPTEDSTITMQEMINVVDELLVELTIQKQVPLATIEGLADPLHEATYSEFLSKHLLARDEDTRIIESLRKSISY